MPKLEKCRRTDTMTGFEIAHCSAVGRKLSFYFCVVTSLVSTTLGVKVGGKSSSDATQKRLCGCSALDTESFSLQLAGGPFFGQSNSSSCILRRFPLVHIG